MDEWLQVVFDELAKQDLDEARAYYCEKDLELEKRFSQTVIEAVEAIQRDPFLFQKYFGRYRRYVIEASSPFRYTVIYEVAPSLIRVVAVAHNSRHPSHWRRR